LRYYNAEKLINIPLESMVPAELEELTLKSKINWMPLR